MVVLDTCALIELCRPIPKFSKKTMSAIEKSAKVLSVSFAEIACKIAFKSLDIGISAEALHHQFLQISEVEIVDIGVQEWLKSIDLVWPDHKDPADRLIVAYALSLKLPVVSTDKKMKRFYPHVIW